MSLFVPEVLENTLISADRLLAIKQHVQLAPLAAVAEVGSYRGGSAYLIGEQLSANRSFYVYDTFAGLPVPTAEIDTHKAGEFSIPEAHVRKLLSNLPCKPIITKTRFPEGAHEARFGFVHIDVDLYEDMYNALCWFWPRMVAGGVILIDDYLAPTCSGVTLAVGRFQFDRNVDVQISALKQARLIKGGPRDKR